MLQVFTFEVSFPVDKTFTVGTLLLSRLGSETRAVRTLIKGSVVNGIPVPGLKVRLMS